MTSSTIMTMDAESETVTNVTMVTYCDAIEPALGTVKLIIGWVALTLSSLTLAVFVFNKKLRKQHNIFQFHVALAEWMATVFYLAVIQSKVADFYAWEVGRIELFPMQNMCISINLLVEAK